MSSSDLSSGVSFPFRVDDEGKTCIEDVYNRQLSWKYVDDNHLFTFMDGTKAIMKKFRIMPSYCDMESVRTTKELRLTCTRPWRSPEYASVLIPLINMPASSLHQPTTFIIDCRDCANIVKIAPYDFKVGDEMETRQGVKWTCSFGFGEVVRTCGRNNINEKAVVVGHTKTRVYLITDGSIAENHSGPNIVSVTPFARNLNLVERVEGAPVVLNHLLIKGCGDMEDYVVHNSETAYDF